MASGHNFSTPLETLGIIVGLSGHFTEPLGRAALYLELKSLVNQWGLGVSWYRSPLEHLLFISCLALEVVFLALQY